MCVMVLAMAIGSAIHEARQKRKRKITPTTKKVRCCDIITPYCQHKCYNPGCDRAAQLLWDNLTADQQSDLVLHGHFGVNVGGKSFTIYVRDRVRVSYNGVGYLGEHQLRLYAVDEFLPIADQLLMRKLAIEANWKEAVNVGSRCGAMYGQHIGY